MSTYHLAQLNIGSIKAPMDSPVMAGFANNLERINALAEATPGFVWRLQTDEGDATAIRPFDDPHMLVNMSVWRDVESLSRFTFRHAFPPPDAPLAERRPVDLDSTCPAA